MDKPTCLFCDSAPLFDATCSACEEYVLGDENGECYSFKDDGSIRAQNERHSEQIKCSKCGSKTLVVEWQERCHYCEARSEV
ncbi:MAG: hypothetical protein HN976_43210 [Lentisphaerae bacterium]|jgi:hypothetical protein|nr:hypothetical protein [Lentisphaerota bacterium]